MKIFSYGQFDKNSEWYVFDSERLSFMSISKFRGNKEKPSNIFLRYISFETNDPNFRNFRMGLFGENLKHLKIDGKPIEEEGSIVKTNCCYNDDYEKKVRDMINKATETLKKRETEDVYRKGPSNADGLAFGY